VHPTLRRAANTPCSSEAKEKINRTTSTYSTFAEGVKLDADVHQCIYSSIQNRKIKVSKLFYNATIYSKLALSSNQGEM
jgi:hypothetical protein